MLKDSVFEFVPFILKHTSMVYKKMPLWSNDKPQPSQWCGFKYTEATHLQLSLICTWTVSVYYLGLHKTLSRLLKIDFQHEVEKRWTIMMVCVSHTQYIVLKNIWRKHRGVPFPFASTTCIDFHHETKKRWVTVTGACRLFNTLYLPYTNVTW